MKTIKYLLITVFILSWLVLFAMAVTETPPSLMTRAEVQIRLRELGHDNLVVDGKIGRKTNEAWAAEEKKMMDRDMAELIEEFGGINGDE